MQSDDSTSPWAPRVLRENALRRIEEQLASDPGTVNLKFERACLLTELNRSMEARNEYIEILAREPAHLAALNNLGTLLYETGYRTAARTTYAEAVKRHPNDPMSLVNLANVLRENGELTQAQELYEKALLADPHHSEAHKGLAYVLMDLGDEQGAALHRREGYRNHAVVALPYRGDRQPLTLLQLVSTTGGNVPTAPFLDNRVFQTTVIFPEFYDKSVALPPHQIVFNAIGDADLSPQALREAQALLSQTKAPVINSPAAVLATGREANSRRLSNLPGIIAPLIVTFTRASLADPGAPAALEARGFQFPLLIRTPGFHTGFHFVRVDAPRELDSAVQALPGKELIVIQYLDARGEDGKSRKYRVMMIDGQLYPLHLAVSSQWKIHYFTAEMADNAKHREEDAAFLGDMAGVLGASTMDALRRIQTTLGLDYGGVDFGLNKTGEVLFFEANATMVVNPPEPDERWAYRRSAVERIHSAVRKMLIDRASRAETSSSRVQD